jgi:predicted nuclease of predicted toxin-antitoxin system
MKLLLDMNLSQLWLAVLEEAGIEAVHWSSLGTVYSSDQEIMVYARDHGYTICTQDLDFGLMLASTGDGRPSVLQIRAQRVLPHQIGEQVVSALRQMAAELDKGALVTVDPKKTRVRVLPLKPRD